MALGQTRCEGPMKSYGYRIRQLRSIVPAFKAGADRDKTDRQDDKAKGNDLNQSLGESKHQGGFTLPERE